MGWKYATGPKSDGSASGPGRTLNQLIIIIELLREKISGWVPMSEMTCSPLPLVDNV